MHKSNINIALVIPAIAREGITKLVAIQARVLKDAGFNVHLIVLSDFDERLIEELDIVVRSIRILHLKQADSYLSIRNLISSWKTIFPIISFLGKCSIGTIIAHGPYAHFIIRLVSLASALTGTKMSVIQYFHINQYSQFPLNSWRRIVINAVNKALASFLDDSHVFVTEAVKKDVQLNLITHKSSHIVYNPVLHQKQLQTDYLDGLKFYDVLKYFNSDTFCILVSNRIEHSKGQLFFLEVVGMLISRFQLNPEDIQLIIAGDGVEKDKLLDEIRIRKLGGYFHYIGVLSSLELEAILKKINLAVVPSLFEGFSYSALEAISAGCLVLTSDAGGLKEVIKDGDTGFLFEAGNTEDCFKKLSMIYSNRDRKLIDQEAVKADLIERFSIESYTEKLLDVIHEK